MTTAAPTTPAPAPAAPAAAAPAPVAAPAPAAPAAAVPPAAPAAAAPAEPASILGGEPKKGEPAKEPAKQEGAPEKYADFTLPEGIEVKPEALEMFKTTAKDLGLSQASAQKLVDLQAQNVKAEVDGRLSAFKSQVETWTKESQALYGDKSQEKFGLAAKAVESFGTPELRKLLNESGLGNHPELVKFFVKAGEALTEDTHVEGRKAGGDKPSTESLMFPTMGKKS